MKDDCIFCKIANGVIGTTTVYEDDDFRVIMDLNPASKGHCLILPKEHCNDIFDMSEELASKLFVLATKVAKALRAALNPAGLNIVQNNGLAAGQTVFHFHLHLIPRYEGDDVAIGWIPHESVAEELTAIAEEIGRKI